MHDVLGERRAGRPGLHPPIPGSSRPGGDATATRVRVGLAAALVLVLSSCATTPSSPSPSPSASTSTASAPDTPSGSTPSGLPPESTWQADVDAAMAGGEEYLDARSRDAAPTERLAVNLDIDNTMLASQYDLGSPVGPVLRFAERARSLGIAVLVNSARDEDSRSTTADQLRTAGYRVDQLCLRAPDLDVVPGKQACRDRFRDEGFTLVANVGNNDTDFAGGGYERAFQLPNYGVLD